MHPKTELVYSYFLAALREKAKLEGRGIQASWAIDIEKTPTSVYQILKGTAKASFDAQVLLANACGHSYIDFLLIGKKILEGTSCVKELLPSLPEALHRKLLALSPKGLEVLSVLLDGYLAHQEKFES